MYHIQALAKMGEDLRVSGTAQDGVIEAIESTDGLFIRVQFHPYQITERFPPFQESGNRCRCQEQEYFASLEAAQHLRSDGYFLLQRVVGTSKPIRICIRSFRHGNESSIGHGTIR
jgi:hypothetical protein